MDISQDFVEYGLQLSLAVIGVSASYLIQPGNPITFSALIFIPLLYGYTAFISRENFSRSSLLSLSALFFVMVGGVTAVAAVFYSIGNILVSVFSSGSAFKDFYGSTSIPLLLMGLIAGSTVFIYGSINPGFQEELADTAGEKIGSLSQGTIEEMGIVENQRKSQMRMINSTSQLAATLTAEKVMNDVKLTPELQRSLQESPDNVTIQVYRRVKQQNQGGKAEIANRVAETFSRQIKQMNFILVIPLIAGFFYTLQPILGILTGLFGKFFALLSG